MARDEDKLIRQLSLLSFLLSRRRPATARDVQESVEGYAEMSDDTFTRRFFADRSDLAKIGIEVHAASVGEKGDGGEAQLYYLPEEEFRLPAVEFTQPETRALAVALAALDGRFAYARPLRLALTAILGGDQETIAEDLGELPIALAADEDAERAGQQLSRLEEAVTRSKTVRFSYPSVDGPPLERTLDPYSLFLIQGHWYAIGRDHLRDAIRTFRVGRMGSVRFVTEKNRDFSVPADYEPDRYRGRPPWLIGRVRGTAVVKVGDDLAWWVERLEPHVRRLPDDDISGGRFETPYADEAVLLSWVVGLGGSGELLEPPELRARLGAALTRIERAHQGPGHESALHPEEKPRRHAAGLGPDKRAPVAPEHLARAVALLQYLVDQARGSFVTWDRLEMDLGLNRTEIENDLRLINLVNFGGGTFVLTAEAGPEGVEIVRDVMADTFAKAARLSPVMARALLLALDLLGDAFALEGLESLASVREKVRAMVGAEQAAGTVLVDDMLSPPPEILDVLNRAIRDRMVVVIEYFTASRHELGEREVEPYLLFHSPDGWYLEAFCLKAMEQRTFKLERIRSVHACERAFLPRPGVDLTHRRSGRAFSPADAAAWATVRFEPRWRSYLEEEGNECLLLDTGEYEARMPYLDERWMAQHVLSYLGEAVLEQPAGARQRVRELAGVLAARYAGEHASGAPSAFQDPQKEGLQ